jgi:hypothetical protein
MTPGHRKMASFLHRRRACSAVDVEIILSGDRNPRTRVIPLDLGAGYDIMAELGDHVRDGFSGCISKGTVIFRRIS